MLPTSDILGNRVYAAYGVGDDGVMQVLGRQRLLPPPYGIYQGDINNPTDAQLIGRRRLSCTNRPTKAVTRRCRSSA